MKLSLNFYIFFKIFLKILNINSLLSILLEIRYRIINITHRLIRNLNNLKIISLNYKGLVK